MTNNELKSQFLLNPEITYLNFGSFGACPKTIFADYQKWQLLLESEPAQFIAFDGVKYLKASREALAAYVNCDADDLVYVTNPTYAINIIAKSLKLDEGDEVLSTNIEYGALDRTWNYYCNKGKAKYVRQPIVLPVTSKEAIIEQFWKGYSNKTKAIFISQITSTTGLILPVKEICEMAKAKGLLTIVDGAHVPGHIPLDLTQIEADIYTGACHKWMMTPKGNTFLYVKKQYQDLFDPLAVSWGYESAAPSHSRFIDYHQMQGTRDFSAFLTTAKALAFMQENNWEQVAANCRQLAQNNYERFCTLVGSTPLCPVTDEFLGQMCSIPIKTTQPEKLQRHLFEHYKIEIPVMRQEQHTFLRYSIQTFNSQADLDKLYMALQEIMANTDLLEVAS
ncbi:aminotransferase [Flavipsychrobacter stenotrophus]|uniref:Aminotransferase n=1 Tax=Flavipsychrobacter stenotrophus TaxID=2077091 RepID=A0A2S7SZY2_9BACT|nr:aminotransferase class V-fold PLP-dependent enzyme [Flavipsychrobacter stenotrophus]PQJ12171.1 aminotransferase [Flavipsychrobacter stenotrophus]